MTAGLKFSVPTKFHLVQLTIIALLLTQATWPVNGAEEKDGGEKSANDKDKVVVSNHQINDKPIIIQTQARDYDEPNLKEYENCHINRESCLKVCETTINVGKCELECPQCPILISHDVAVQGVNDTAFVGEPTNTSGNTTTIIKLTNEIHNVIDTSHNITANNENNVVVHQNISTTGGKYGMGYSDKGPCCMIVRRSSKCGSGGSGGASRSRRSLSCPQKRHRLCSEKHCRAPVMRAKPINYCTLDEDGTEHCDDMLKFEYTPYKRPTRSTRQKCSYTPQWPYVRCTNHQQPNRKICQRCLLLTYGEILQNGLPNACQSCFAQSQSYTNWYPSYPYYPPPQQAPLPETYFPNLDESWQVEKMKCRFPDGTVTDCGPGVTIIDDFDHDTNVSDYSDNDNDFPDLPNDLTNLGDEDFPTDINAEYALPTDEENDEEYMRQRRQIHDVFKRSKYSLRHRD